METKHTPRPWKVDADTDTVTRVNIGREHRNKLLEFALVSGKNHKTNAKLIATAPDLLEAIQNVDFKIGACYDDPEEVGRRILEIWPTLQSVIKKATQ